VNVDLMLYKNQLDIVQKEIRRVQEILDGVEKQRVKAEDDARKARAAVRDEGGEDDRDGQGRREKNRNARRVRSREGNDGRVEGYEEGRRSVERIVERVMREPPPPAARQAPPPDPPAPLSPDVLERPMLNFEEGVERGTSSSNQNPPPPSSSPPLPPIPQSEPEPIQVRPASDSSQSSQSTASSLSRLDMLSAPGFRSSPGLSVIHERPSPVPSRAGSRESPASTASSHSFPLPP